MADFKQMLRALVGGKKEPQQQLERHIMSPMILGSSGNSQFSPDELLFLGINPFEQTQDVSPVSSNAAAHGYLYLQSRSLFDLLDEMCDRDTVVGGCLELIVAYMLMRPQGLTLREDDADKPGATEALDLVQRLLVDGSNWSYMLWSMAEGLLRHGRSTNEITWHVTPDGYYTPQQFYHCHPGQFTFDRNGKMYLSMADGRNEHTPLMPLKFLSVARPALYDNPWGSSLIYPCRFLYHFKKRSQVFRLRYAENHGEPIYHAWVDATSSANPEESRNRLAEALASIGRNNFIVTTQGENLEVHQRGGGGLSGGGGASLHGSIAEDYDRYMVTRLLGATLGTGTAANGNRALGEVHERTILNRILPPSSLLAYAINTMLINPWCDLNLPAGSPRPYWYIDVEESTDAKEARETLETAVKCGLEVAASEARERLGYRQPTEDEDTIGGAGFTPLARQATQEAAVVPVAASETKRERIVMQSKMKPTARIVAMQQYDYGCAMLRLPDYQSAEVDAWAREMIDREDLADNGIVSDHHITLLYGITNDDPKPVKRAVMGCWPAVAWYGPLKCFSNEDADVLYVEVDADSWGLDDLRREIVKGVDYDSDVDKSSAGYKPHVTIAYLKPGRGSKYTTAVDDDGQPTDWPVYGPLAFDLGILDTVIFSTRDDEVQYEFMLTGPYAQFSERVKGELLPWAERWVKSNVPPDSAMNDASTPLPNETSAAFGRFITRAQACGATEAQIAPMLRAVFNEKKLMPDTNDYYRLYAEIGKFRDFEKSRIESETEQYALTQAIGHADLTLERWREEPAVRMAEQTRAVQEQATMQERWQMMGEKLHAETRDSLFEMMRKTVRNIDALWVDNNAPLSTRAYNAIDIEPIVDAADEAAKLATYGSFLMALAYIGNVSETVVSIKESRKPKFWNAGKDRLDFAEDDFTFEGWATAYGDAADWMISRGVMTVAQIRYVAGLMADETGQDRDKIERELRDGYFALSRTVDVNATKKVQNLIAGAVGRGETINQFLTNVDAQLGVGELPGGMDGYWENVWRTEMANAYSQQQEEQENDPDFQEILWGHLGGNPKDMRSDPTHARFSGVYYKNKSAASQALGRTPFRYRCRCYRTPLVDPDPENSDYEESGNAMSVALNLTRF